MATVLFLNNYQTTLGAALSSTATTMTVSSTTGLPSSLASGQFIPMTLTPASNPGSAYEIVYVTGISGSSLTVTRGEEGTSALNWNTGDILYSTNTAETTGTSTGSPTVAFQTDALTASGLITANGGLTVPSGQTETVAGTLDVTGTITIPNASANNEPVALGQFPYLASGNQTNGYIKFPNGIILQWGALTTNGSSSGQVITYPIAFPNAMIVSMANDQGTGMNTGSLVNLSNSQGTIYAGTAANTYAITGIGWWAVGY